MSDARDKSPWYGTAEEGLLWILRDETCKTEQVELVAEKALEKIEALLSLSADRGREIESLQRENEELSGQLQGLHLYYEGHEAQMEELRAAAITPEQREKLDECIAGYRISGTDGNRKYWAVELISAVRDLLGEQG